VNRINFQTGGKISLYRRIGILMFKHPRKRFLRLGCFVLLGSLLGCFLGGCGIKGPLYLPQEKTAAAAPTPTETAPAPQDTTK
jgi:predicted small lipoprotein YifL